MTIGEEKYLTESSSKLDQLKDFLFSTNVVAHDPVDKWHKHFSVVKELLGNHNNWSSFTACMMARDYLVQNLGVPNYCVAATHQNATGFDVDTKTSKGDRIIGEVKTTTPCGAKGLGANQQVSIQRDLDKLAKAAALHKFLFLTDVATRRQILNQPFPNSIQIVFLN